MRKLIETREYNAGIAKYIPGILKVIFQGMIEGTDTKEQPSHLSDKDMENLESHIAN